MADKQEQADDNQDCGAGVERENPIVSQQKKKSHGDQDACAHKAPDPAPLAGA
jgi:hypothetical protein